MLGKIVLSATILATPSAFAQSVSPGADMLARLIGVEPGAYTVNELVQMQAALDENDSSAFNLVRRGRPSSEVITTKGMNPGVRQICHLEDGYIGMTLNQVYRRCGVVTKDEGSVLDHEIAGTRPYPRAHVSPGEAQMAAALGVDAANYTLSELVQMSSPAGDD